jgi:hypothetical protein
VRLAILAFVFLPTAAFVGVTAIGRRFAINYDDPLWVVWPVFTAALLLLLLGVTLVELLSVRSSVAAVQTPTGFETPPATLKVAHHT